MYISSKDWKNYIDQLSALDKKAGDLMREWIQKHGFSDSKAMISYAYALAQKYGEGSAALSAEMYDAVADMQTKLYPPAVAAPAPSYGEVAKTVNGILKHSQNPNSVANGVSRLVKRTGVDTTLNNALRDGAEFAWVPNGDTCAFCITLASRGWQKMSKKALKGGHAEHIHANCDCTYSIRFDGRSGVKGYDPQKYKDMYYGAEGNTPKERINSLRRMRYEQNKDVINAQKRETYLYASRSGAHKESFMLIQSGGKETGGHHYPVRKEQLKRDQDAARAYEKFAREDDSERIAKYTGFSQADIAKVRSHVFSKKHDLYVGYERFEPDYDMAVAWQRLRNGDYLPRDLTLLRHELLEMEIEKKYNIPISEAHAKATEVYDWWGQVVNELGEGGEPDGLLQID